jgi:hypothetical protein
MNAAYQPARIAGALAAFIFVIGMGGARAQVTDTKQSENQKAPAELETSETNSPPKTVPERALRDVGPSDVRLGFEGGWRHSLNGEYDAMVDGTLSLEFRALGYGWGNVSLGAGSLGLKSGTSAAVVAHDPVFLQWGIGYRQYFTPPHTLLQPYVGATFSFLWVTWDYRQEMESGGNTIRGDSMQGLDARLAAGLSLRVLERCHVFGEVNYGGMGFMDVTNAELRNDWLKDFSYVGLRVGLKLVF